MYDFLALNYVGPSYRRIKREIQNGIQFISGKHTKVFAAVVEIYRDAIHALNITGPMLVILAKDETKVKGKLAWEAKWDTLGSSTGSAPKLDHIHVLRFW